MAVIAIAIMLRIALASIHAVSGDACWQLSNAGFIAESKKLPLFEQFGRDEPFWAPPLFHLISAFFYSLFSSFSSGIAEFAIKMVSPILGSLALIIFYKISRMLFDEKISFYSLLFMAFIPLHIDYSVFSYADSTVTFLAVLSVYFALKNKIILSSIASGLAILTKYNGIFILPVLLYIVYTSNKGKEPAKKLIIFSIISLSIGSVWFIRNWIYLGNPVWPFMNSVFKGVEYGTFAESEVGKINIANIFSLSGIAVFYLGIFGVPDGNIATLSFVKVPYFQLFFAIWLLSTFVFLIPFIFGVFSKMKHKKMLSIWILSYIVLTLLYILNASWSVSRFMLPAFPAIALIWAQGLNKIKFKGQFLVALIILIAVGFIFTSILKISIAAREWNFYMEDFEWAKDNTKKESIFISGSQCVSYHIGRQTISQKIINLEKADYAFVNQNFRLDNRAKIESDLLLEIKKRGNIIYSNEKTKTEIYKIG
ncbi:glycosyltransferase family 39 protein [Candidatus Woesearchaeota archaeon]|nr:glycosyltransferase family 39 protein [Candidatus Woesearchaeota archaeon]